MMAGMDMKLEVVILPVSDVDRSLAFYRDQAGFALEVDYAPNPRLRVVQLTPPGSAASIQLTHAAGELSARETYLVVADLEGAVAELTDRGLAVEGIIHKQDAADWQGDFEPGIDPERHDYSSFAKFVDPDGHQWVLQERGHSG
jgi:catechol 2,3-dioxygenase-like lactoylglutathione lyase family enzyme